MTMDEFVTQYGSVVEGKAAQLARQYPGIDAEDVSQEIYLAIMAEGRLPKLTANPDLIGFAAFRVGKAYCDRERNDFMFHSAQYVYTPREVRALFADAFFDRAIWQQAPKKDDGSSVTAGGVVIALWDLDAAFNSLSAEDQVVIQQKDERKETVTAAEQKRYERAVDKVTRYLNRGIAMGETETRVHDGPGSRRAVSNASARYATSEV